MQSLLTKMAVCKNREKAAVNNFRGGGAIALIVASLASIKITCS